MSVSHDKPSPSLDNRSVRWHIQSMRQVLSDVQAGKLTEELRRRGIPPEHRLRVVIESLGEDSLPITAINAAGGAFGWLGDEPDLYTDVDLVERYRE
jgi:hypothetical protein